MNLCQQNKEFSCIVILIEIVVDGDKLTMGSNPMFGFDEISKVGLGLGLGLIRISKMGLGLGLGLIKTPQVGLGLGLMGSNPFMKPGFEPIDQTHWVCTSLLQIKK